MLFELIQIFSIILYLKESDWFSKISYVLKMVNFVESAVKEYSGDSSVELCCKICSCIFAEFRYVRVLSRYFYEIARVDVSWDANYTILSDSVILCQCGECLGNACVPNIYILYKKAFKLVY